MYKNVCYERNVKINNRRNLCMLNSHLVFQRHFTKEQVAPVDTEHQKSGVLISSLSSACLASLPVLKLHARL